MSVALIVQNKTKISFFLCANFLLFCRHKLRKFSSGSPPIPTSALPWMHLGAYSTRLTPSCIQERHTLLRVHLNDQSIKKTFSQPLL